MSSPIYDDCHGLVWGQILQPPASGTSELAKPPVTRRKQMRQQQPSEPAALECLRCFSTNTKFCYYNNYNKSQPRHLCKSCKRHWTKGGALRSVPVGGARKHKRCAKVSKAAATAIAPSSVPTGRLNGSSAPYSDPSPNTPFLFSSLSTCDYMNVYFTDPIH